MKTINPIAAARIIVVAIIILRSTWKTGDAPWKSISEPRTRSIEQRGEVGEADGQDDEEYAGIIDR